MKMTFCLRDAKAKGQTPLYAFIHWAVDGRYYQWKLATGERIEPRLWDRKRRRVKKGSDIEALINDRLALIESNVRTAFSRLEALGKPLTPEAVRQRYREVTGKAKAIPQRDFFADYEAFIEASKQRCQTGTIQIHNTTKTHLTNFAKAYGLRITYDQCTVLLFDKFLAYLNNVVQLNNASAWKIIRTLRVFLRHAVEQEWSASNDYLKFTARRMPKGESSEKVYVTIPELELIKALDLSRNRRLDVTRDLFLFQCSTGLRYGDLQRIGPEHVEGNELRLVTGKNKKAIRVPLMESATAILAKYDGHLPKRSNQKQNESLKDLMALATIDRQMVVVEYRGVQRIERTVAKSELIGTHAAKRTYVSLLRQHGVTVESICRLTGNSRATIERYILKDEQDLASEVAKIREAFA